jgi:hypothetical protein
MGQLRVHILLLKHSTQVHNMNEKKFMELVAELREQGFSQQEAIEEARKQLGEKDMAKGGRVDKPLGPGGKKKKQKKKKKGKK